MQTHKIKLNMWVAIFDIFDVILLSLSWALILGAAASQRPQDTDTMVLVIMGFQWLGLILHIWALIESRRHQISIVGAVIGIIGCGLSSVMLLLAFPSIILLIVALIFLFIQHPTMQHN